MTVTEPSVLRLLVFTLSADDGYVDNALRSLSRSLAGLPLCSIDVGRRQDEARERVIATTWPDLPTMIAALGPGSELSPGPIEVLPVMEDPTVRVAPLAFSLTFDRSSPPSVLRVYRGRARPGELDQYAAEVRDGAFADASAAHGPLTLCLGREEPDRFVTVSTWTDLDTIMTATGGSLTNPIATRHSHRLIEGTADLYEILPDTAVDVRPVPTPT